MHQFKETFRNGLFRIAFSVLFILVLNNVHAQSPSWEWANALNTVATEFATDVLTDPATNEVYVVGLWQFNLSAFFPTGQIPEPILVLLMVVGMDLLQSMIQTALLSGPLK